MDTNVETSDWARSGERQVAPTLAGIRPDHIARYAWAANVLPPGCRVLDVACGVGYGAYILASRGFNVTAVDRDQRAIDYARQHYSHSNASYQCRDILDRVWAFHADAFDAVTCFETIEHLEHPIKLLDGLHEIAPLVLASVPNEEVFPWKNYAFHYRHYTQAEFADLLSEAAFEPTEWLGQAGTGSDAIVVPGMRGRTLVVKARRRGIARRVEMPESPPTTEPPAANAPTEAAEPCGRAPEHVAILGLGPSVQTYLELTKRLGGRSRFVDEVWTINALGDVFASDLVFHMDDVRIQEIRAAADPTSNIAAMLAWLKTYNGRVITSRAHPDYPALEEFPLEAAVNRLGFDYYNSTAAYAIVYAILLGVKRISCFGMDYTYADAAHAEKGRACVEFWLGVAHARGIQVISINTSTLLDACLSPAERHYGYDTLDLEFVGKGAGNIRVIKTPKEALPTADEIEHAYDHSRHPNALVEAEQEA